MAIIKVGNNSIGKISVIEPYDDFHGVENELTYEPSQEPWVRPSDWLDMPTVTDGVAALIYVPSGAQDFGISLYARNGLISSSPTYVPVDWGDGTSGVIGGLQTGNPQNPGFFTWTHKTYNFDDLPPETEIIQNGTPARQVIIQLDASVSGMAYVDIGGLGGSSFGYYSDEYVDRDGYADNRYLSSTLLDLVVRGSSITNFYTGNYRSVNHKNLQSVVLDVASIHTASYLFYNCQDLRNIEIASGAMSSQTNFQSTFGGCWSLTEAPYMDTSNATGVYSMFGGCRNLKTVPVYDTSNVTDFTSMFTACWSLYNFPQLDYSNGTKFTSTFNTCYSLTSLPSGNFNGATHYDSMFSSCYRLLASPPIDFSNALTINSIYYSCDKLKIAPKINAPNLTGLYSCQAIFQGCNSIEKIHIQDVGNTTSLNNAFAGCNSLVDLKWDNPEEVQITGNAGGIFASCVKLKNIPAINTSGITNFYTMYSSCRSVEKFPTIDMSNATNCAYMFTGCHSAVEISFKNIKQKPVCHSMFDRCYGLRQVPSGMFEDYDSTPRSVRDMFNQCGITEVSDLVFSGAYDTSSNNTGLFANLYYLKSVNNLTINTEYGTRNMFANCSSLESVHNLDISNTASDNNGMFSNCTRLHTVNIPEITKSIGFYQCFLGSGEITKIFNNLTSGVTGQSIDIRYNYGTSQLHPDTLAIATSKGWTVLT